jgi:hypothetical protein
VSAAAALLSLVGLNSPRGSSTPETRSLISNWRTANTTSQAVEYTEDSPEKQGENKCSFDDPPDCDTKGAYFENVESKEDLSWTGDTYEFRGGIRKEFGRQRLQSELEEESVETGTSEEEDAEESSEQEPELEEENENEMAEEIRDALRNLAERMDVLQTGEQGSHKPPIFTGRAHEDLELFLKRYTDYADFQHWDENRRLQGIRLYLSGMAYQFFNGLPVATRADLDAVLQALRNKFTDPQDRWVDDQNLYTRYMGKDEPLESYVEDITLRFGKLGKQPGEQISLFIHGLTPQLKSFVVARGPETFDQAVKLARRAEGIRAMNAAAGPAAINAVTVDSMPVCHPARPTLENESLYFAINELRDEIRGSRKPEVTPSRTCTFCRKTGHIARDCYKKRNLDRERLCYRCEQKGHVARNCTGALPVANEQQGN